MPRPLLGIFIAWQGKPYFRGADLIFSFWNRSRRAGLVAQGSVRELHARLSDYRSAELARWTVTPEGHQKPVLVHIGHSFGGYMLYVAQAQALMMAAVDTEHRLSTADLIILVNPAFAAISYLPIEELLSTRRKQSAPALTPLFIAVTSRADLPTKWLFKAGMYLNVFTEGFSGRLQRQALHTTIGHTERLRTHELSLTGSGKCNLASISVKPLTPFWIISASKQVIPNHSNIFEPAFEAFLLQTVADRLR